MGELPLLIFTICVQASIGIMVFVAVGKLLNKEGFFKMAILTAAALAVISLVASLLHLGKPLSSFNSLLNFGSSWLSREIWFTGIFAGITVITALLVLFMPAAKNAIKALSIVAAAIGLADVFMITSSYVYSGVPAWQYGAIYFEFYAAAVSMGALLFFAISLNEAANMRKIIAATVAIAVVVQVVAMVPYYINMGVSDSVVVQQSLGILANHSIVMAIKWLSIILGAILVFIPIKSEKNLSYGIYGATALIIIGQTGGRYLFYAMMIASRVGLN